MVLHFEPSAHDNTVLPAVTTNAPQRSSDDRQGGNEVRLRVVLVTSDDVYWERRRRRSECSATHCRTVRTVRSDVRGMRSRVRAPVGTIPVRRVGEGCSTVAAVCGLCGARFNVARDYYGRRCALRWCAAVSVYRTRDARDVYYNIIYDL